jgi:uncharacterized membrane protein
MSAFMAAKSNQGHVAAFLSSDRVASLSDTIFGVSMTLLAATLLPSVLTIKGSVFDMLRDMHEELAAVLLSFAISGSYWVVQQHRLAMTKSVTPRQTLLHFVFLFLIVLLPISTGLWVRGGATQATVMIYGINLSLIALVNLLLWIDVHRSVVAHAQIVRSSLALALFIVALAIGALWPYMAQFLWLSVFATSLLSRNVARRLIGK